MKAVFLISILMNSCFASVFFPLRYSSGFFINKMHTHSLRLGTMGGGALSPRGSGFGVDINVSADSNDPPSWCFMITQNPRQKDLPGGGYPAQEVGGTEGIFAVTRSPWKRRWWGREGQSPPPVKDACPTGAFRKTL